MAHPQSPRNTALSNVDPDRDPATEPVHETDYQRFARLYPDDDSLPKRKAIVRDQVADAARDALLFGGHPMRAGDAEVERIVMLQFQQVHHAANDARRRFMGRPCKPTKFREIFMPLDLLILAYSNPDRMALVHAVDAWPVAWNEVQADPFLDMLPEVEKVALALEGVCAALAGEPWPWRAAQQERAAAAKAARLAGQEGRS